MLEHVVGVGLGHARLSQQLHSRLARSPSRLVVVAGNARANNVIPGVWTVPPPRHNVVESELARALATVLAGESVPIEHCLPRKSAAHHRPLHHVDQAYDRWRGEQFRNALDMSTSIYHKLSFAPPYQDDCASHVADVERLVILVEHQNRRINCAHSTPSGGLVCQKLPELDTVQP